MTPSISPVAAGFSPQTAAGPRAADGSATGRSQGTSGQIGGRQLSAEEQRRIAELEKTDKAVHAHEAAHLAAAGGLAVSGASYTYVYGPDGKRYAVGGEVGIDTSAESKPQANIDKGRRVRAAAMAPADPSPQDYAVASAGDQLVALGRRQLAAEQRQQRAAAGAYATAGGASSTPTISVYA